MAASPRFRVSPILLLILSLLLGFQGCWSTSPNRSPQQKPRPAPAAPVPASPQEPVLRAEKVFPVMLGIDVLEREDFARLKGKRIGLLTNAAGVDGHGVSTIEVLRRAKAVKLAALFAPEHGIYGDEEAGKNISDTVDRRTGLPVFSLHGGRSHKPTKAMLKGIDALVIDLQDIGARSYTFVSAMRFAVEGCFENSVEVIVLDRPNPLGGIIVNGPLLDADLGSYVGAFRVPYIHGMTIGELAQMAVTAPGVLAVSERVRLRGRLTVVPMRGWRRSMRWPDTGLKFVPTSPYVPDFSACVGYAMCGLGCEIGGFSHGTGNVRPFISFRGRTSEQLQKELASLRLPGLAFVKTSGPDSAKKAATGVQIEVTDWSAWHPTDLSFHMMRLSCRWSGSNPFAAAPADKASLFLKLVGSRDWWNALRRDGARVDVEGFLADWHRRAEVFRQQSKRYWLYPE